MKKVFSLITFLGILSFSSFSQLDSTNASVSFSSIVDSTYLDSINVPADFMTVNVWVNDPVATGNIMVSVYEITSGYPMARIHWNSTKLQSMNPLNENNFLIPVGFLDSNLGYTIHVEVKDTQAAVLPELTFSYP